MNKFKWSTKVYVKDTNVYGGVYFSRYFEWQGMAREEFFASQIINAGNFFAKDTQIATIDAQMQYNKGLAIYDSLQVLVETFNINKGSLDLLFTFCRQSNLDFDIIGVGRQTLCFVSNGRVIPLPEFIASEARKFSFDSDGSIIKNDMLFYKKLKRKGYI